MKQQLQDIIQRLAPIRLLIGRYMGIGVFLLFTTAYIVLILRIHQLYLIEPTSTQVSNTLQAVQHPHIDPQTLTKIQQLQDQNIQVKTLFDQARQNPFAE